MNNKIKILLIILAVVPSFIANGQNIGYQGRKTTFYYNAYVSPRSISNKTETLDNQTMNIGHAFEFDFNYSPSNSLGFAYRSMNSRQVDLGNMITTTPDLTLVFKDEVMPTFTPTSIGMFIKFRRFDKLSPLGRHQKLAIYYNQVTVDYNPNDVMNRDNFSNVDGSNGKPEYSRDPWGNLNGKTYSNISIGYSIGNQRIIGNRYLFTYGLEYVYTPNANVSDEFIQRDADTYFEEVALYEAARSSLINFHIGFGILGPRKKSRR